MSPSDDLDAEQRQHLHVLESPAHQEWRARQALSWSTVIKVGLAIGLVFFFLPGGAPWTGPASGTSAMGRPLPWPWPLIVLAHFALSIGYMACIGFAVYRQRLVGAIATGILCGALLFILNSALFALYGVGDMRLFFGHLVFGLFGAIAYKAISVPPPRVKA